MDRNLGKTNSLNEKDLEDFLILQKTKADSENSWSVDIADVAPHSFDLSVKNPYKITDSTLRAPSEIIAEMKSLDVESAEIVEKIMGMLG
jgi:type I restriction enzyme M protein